MYRKDTDKIPDAPELEYFFTCISSNEVNYCVVCLRTENERKLKKNNTLKKFAKAVKLDSDFQQHLICYICERQAQNALKFLRTAAFASALNKIFQEVMQQEPTFRKSMFQRDNFKKLVEELHLNSDKSLPGQWETELQYVRSTTKLNETKTLVVDNKRAKVYNSPIIFEDEIYVIPDDPPPLNPFGEVTATAVRSSQSSNSDSKSVRQRPCPKRFQINSETSENRPDSTVSRGEQETAESVVTERCRAPLTEEVADPTVNVSFILRSPDPKVSETLVVLLDDDDDGKDSQQIRIEKVTSEAPETPPVTKAQTLNDTSLITATKPPRLIPIDKLREKPNTQDTVIMNTDITTPDKDILMTNNQNFVLHPIMLTGGMLTVPTLAASIVNGQLIYQPEASLGLQNIPIENRSLKDLIQSPLKEIPAPVNPVSIFNPSKPNERSGQSETVKVSDIISQSRIKPIKRPNKNVYTTKPSKVNKGLPVIQSVTSQAENSTRIDWEDKIPMDVISFMDAVDPNPSILPEASMTANIGLSEVQTSNQASQSSSPSNFKSYDIIDLC